MRRSAGFTLVELVMVIVIIAILLPLAVVIIKPIEGYIALDRRAELTDAADSALRLMAREIRAALPNSVRVNATNDAIEFINATDAGRYRLNGATANEVLNIGGPDTEFDIVGSFSQTTPGVQAGARLVVYNLGPGQAPYDAYLAAGTSAVMTPSTTSITVGAAGSGANANEQHITLGAAHTFTGGSTRQRIFLVDGAITYACAGTTLTRYSGYGFNAAITVPPVGGSSATTATSATGCTFTYAAGTPTRAGLVTISLTLSSGGETVTMFRQVRVDNAS